jgi:hypothetical protein
MAEKIGKVECKTIARLPRNKVFQIIHFSLYKFRKKTIQRQDTIQHNENMTYLCQIIHQLRNSETDLVLPFPKSEFKKKIFSYSEATLWNNLPIYYKTIQFYELFQKTNEVTFSKAIIICK